MKKLSLLQKVLLGIVMIFGAYSIIGIVVSARNFNIYMPYNNIDSCINQLETVFKNHPQLNGRVEKYEAFDQYRATVIVSVPCENIEVKVFFTLYEADNDSINCRLLIKHISHGNNSTNMYWYNDNPTMMISLIRNLSDNFFQYIDGAYGKFAQIIFWIDVYAYYSYFYVLEAIAFFLLLLVLASYKNIDNKFLYVAIILLLIAMFFSICTKSEPYYLFKEATPMTTFLLWGIIDAFAITQLGGMWVLCIFYIVAILVNIFYSSRGKAKLLLISSGALLLFGIVFSMSPGVYYYFPHNDPTPISHVDTGFYLLMASAVAALIGQTLQLFRSHK